MKEDRPRTHTDSAHQIVTENIRLQLGQKSTQIGFTDQRLSPLAGMLSGAAYLCKKKVPALLERMLPHQPTSPNALPPPQIALSFLAGVIAGADKLPRVAHLRADPAGRAILLSPPTPISGVFCYRGQLSAESNQRNVLRLRDHAASTGPRSIERGIEEARTKSFSVTTRLLMQLNTVDSATNGLISSIKSDPNAGRPKRGW